MAGPDYYAILGVLPSAEDVVIKAAYKALAQRYHPDKYAGSPEEATRRMAEINEAYAVLSDPMRRKEYDAAQSKNGASDGEDLFSDEDEGADPFLVELNAKWNVAVTYFDDLIGIEAWLNKISSRLSFAYKVVLVETRKFDRRVEIAADMEQEFLSRYFGDQPEIVRFARYCVEIGNRAALKDLNRAIVVMGFSAQPGTVVSRIRVKHFPPGHRTPWEADVAPAQSSPTKDGNESATIIETSAENVLFWTVGAILFVCICFALALAASRSASRQSSSNSGLAQGQSISQSRPKQDVVQWFVLDDNRAAELLKNSPRRFFTAASKGDIYWNKERGGMPVAHSVRSVNSHSIAHLAPETWRGWRSLSEVEIESIFDGVAWSVDGPDVYLQVSNFGAVALHAILVRVDNAKCGAQSSSQIFYVRLAASLPSQKSGVYLLTGESPISVGYDVDQLNVCSYVAGAVGM